MTRRAKMPLNQLEIQVPPAPHAIAEFSPEDKEREYRRAMGDEAYERQRRMHIENTSCSCGKGDAVPIKQHRPGCKKIPLRFGSQR